MIRALKKRNSPLRTGILLCRVDRCTVLLMIVAVGFLGGCLPADADFSLGISTSRIDGRFNLERLDTGSGPPLVIAIKHHHKFTTLDAESRITHPTAHVIRVDPSGAFTVFMPSDVVAIDLILMAPDHLSRQFAFKRSLGVGDITIKAELKPMPAWRSHFYTFIEPQLQHMVVEQRYEMNEFEQGLLFDWLTAQQKRLEEGREQARRRDTSRLRGAGGSGQPE